MDRYDNRRKSSPAAARRRSLETIAPNSRARSWKTAEVLEWLRDNKFGFYVNYFREDKVDGPDLLAMTERDLKYIGVSSEKDRRDLYQLIRDLD
eukprot:TRINITY_DN3909_c0_g1_i1.p1 TRINITY_DN3909_c0_g1~~TRINITY_DN3909_c0_g1_i1.p1  ORF type:complete len:94 (+),score=8.62 TRINITY_DN3909_c0_g1_i1:70-351(+)